MAAPKFTAADVPEHVDFDARYEIKEIHYRTIHGKLLMAEPMILKSSYAPGDWLVLESVRLRVKRVALADGIQHVNVEPHVETD